MAMDDRRMGYDGEREVESCVDGERGVEGCVDGVAGGVAVGEKEDWRWKKGILRESGRCVKGALKEGVRDEAADECRGISA